MAKYRQTPDNAAFFSNDQTIIENVTICICTYKRPELVETLASIRDQVLPDNIRLNVIVADNDEHAIRRPEIEASFDKLGLQGRYIHAPKQNISVARNACLDNTNTDWVVFVDDDEIAKPNWIATLMAKRIGTDCVFGVSQALYDTKNAPAWMVAGDFHSNRIGPRDGIHNGYTCNTLISMSFIRQNQMRFAEELGQVGGEDTVFFNEMATRNAKFAYAANSIVTEVVPPQRATLSWLLKRRFRSGQIHYVLLKRAGMNHLLAALLASTKCAVFLMGALVSVFSRKHFSQFLLRSALQWGVVRSAFGASLYKEYA